MSVLMITANSSGELTDASRPSCAIRSRRSAFATIRTNPGMHLIDDDSRRGGGRQQPEPGDDLKVWKARLCKRWKVGNNRRAPERGDGKCAQLAIANDRQDYTHVLSGRARLQRWVDSHRAVGPPIECAAIGGRFCHALGPDTPAGTRNILDRSPARSRFHSIFAQIDAL
jgi:hypothetical protein